MSPTYLILLIAAAASLGWGAGWAAYRWAPQPGVVVLVLAAMSGAGVTALAQTLGW